jgi:hypothetical protein
MRLLIVLLACLPAVAQAQPFDLAQLRADWPGYAYVVLEQSHEFSLVDGTLRVDTQRQLAILNDTAREELSLFETTVRPGCREPGDIVITTTGRDGTEQTTTGDDLAKLRMADHSDSKNATVVMKGPRRGISPGALLNESFHVDYPPQCYGGLLATARTLGDPLGPILREEVRVSCAGGGCFAALDRDSAEQWVTSDDGMVLVRENVEPLPPESHFPGQDRPRVYVSSSDDPNAAALHLEPRLDEAVEGALGVVASYAALAKKDYPGEKDPAVRLARSLAYTAVFGDGSFWEYGFGMGDVPRAGARALRPMEWWAVAAAALNPHGGVPVLLDSTSHLPPPDVGNVTGWNDIGVLVPGRFLLLQGEFLALTSESAENIAGRHALLLDGGAEARQFAATADLNRHRWTGTVELTIGDYLKYEISGELQGSQAAVYRQDYAGTVASWQKRKRSSRGSESERDRGFVGRKVFHRDISLGTVEPVGKRLDAVSVSAIFSRAAEVQRGEGVVSLVVPLPLGPQLEGVVSLGERHRPFELSPVDVAVDFLIKTPEGHSVAGLPEPRAVTDGPVRVASSWESAPDGVRLKFEYRVDAAVLDPQFATSVHAAGELVRQAVDGYVLFVKD